MSAQTMKQCSNQNVSFDTLAMQAQFACIVG